MLDLKANEQVKTYVGPIELKITQDDKGRGMFATQDIKQG